MRRPRIRLVPPFVAATLVPVPLLVLGALFGSVFILAAVLYLTAFVLLLDRLVHTAGADAAPGVQFPAAGRLSQALAILHFPLLALGVAAVSGATGLGFWEGLGALLAFGLFFGQVSNSNAHELIHRTEARLFALGKWVLISLLYGHHVTAHLRIHHRYVATPDDPNSAARGEGFYAFAARAWGGAFLAGWEIENAIAAARGRRLRLWEHPYTQYVAGGAAFALAATALFGLSGLIAYLLLAGYAQLQLLVSDYVQHYGLRRRRTGDDRYEPVAPWHSWNAPHWFSGGLMLNAPRHSEHHTNPARPYPELSLPAASEGPRLPYSLPAMGAIALLPPVWRRVMDRRAADWQRRIDAGAVQRTRPPAPVAAAPPRAPAATPASGDAAMAAGEAPAPAPAAMTRAVTPAAAAAQSRNAAQARELASVMGEPELLSAELMRRLRESAPVLPDEVAERKRRAAEAARQRAPTPTLWSDPEDEAPDPAETPESAGAEAAATTPRFVRSSALFTAEAEPPAEILPPPPPPDPPFRRKRDLAAEQAVIDQAIAEVVATARKESRRQRAKLPTLEPAQDGAEPDGLDRLRYLAAGAALAARALANVLRGGPSRPPDGEAAGWPPRNAARH